MSYIQEFLYFSLAKGVIVMEKEIFTRVTDLFFRSFL
jgi:hypothetical protein